MSKKYIDLAPQIASMHDQPLGTMRVALGLLDEFASAHPDQVPGRTLTRSDMVEAFGEEYAGWATHRLARIGYTIAPDPKLTNLQRLTHAILDWAEGRGADRILARHLNAIGVKAPGGDDE